MTNEQKITAWVVFAAVSLLLIYDAYAVFHGGVADTISWVIYDQSKQYPIISFGIGVLCGHLFWQMTAKK